jgi:formylglycine-generating enzyme required for sulfatase activity
MFTMGGHYEDEVEDENDPKGLVSIKKPFFLGETTVTQELFEKVMGFNPSYHQGKEYPKSKRRPVENVTWFDALIFCNKLSVRLGKKPYYNISNVEYGQKKESEHIRNALVTINPRSNGFRLPLEKEWEYASKAGTNNRWSGTDDRDKLGEYASFYDEKKDRSQQPYKTQVVKSLKPNEWGFFDMSGNVEEWCWDEYKLENRSNKREFRVTRGGNYESSFRNVRSDSRQPRFFDTYFEHMGFRIASNVIK